MNVWIHIIAVIAIVIYSGYSFLKQKRVYHIIIVIWALLTLLNYVNVDPIVLKAAGVAQIIMFIIVVYLMFRRRHQSRMSTLELLAQMSAESLPTDEQAYATSVNEEKQSNKLD